MLLSGLTSEEAFKKEQEYIEKYKSNMREYGYNICPGGYNGGGSSKNVAMYNLQGEFLKCFPSASAASRILCENGIKVSCSTISAVCRYADNVHSGGGYMWRYINNKNILHKIDPYNDPHKKSIIQYDLHGNFIKEWESAEEAARYYKNQGIERARKGYTITSAGFQWRFKNSEVTVKDVSDKYFVIYAYTMGGDYIDCFTSKKEAVESLNINGYLKNTSQFKDITSNDSHGYRWTTEFYEKLPPLNKGNIHNPVVQIDCSTNKIIEIYNSCNVASKTLPTKIESRIITKCCKEKVIEENQIAAGYRWRFLSDIKESDISDSFLLLKYKNIINHLEQRNEVKNGNEYVKNKNCA